MSSSTFTRLLHLYDATTLRVHEGHAAVASYFAGEKATCQGAIDVILALTAGEAHSLASNKAGELSSAIAAFDKELREAQMAYKNLLVLRGLRDDQLKSAQTRYNMVAISGTRAEREGASAEDKQAAADAKEKVLACLEAQQSVLEAFEKATEHLKSLTSSLPPPV